MNIKCLFKHNFSEWTVNPEHFNDKYWYERWCLNKNCGKYEKQQLWMARD